MNKIYEEVKLPRWLLDEIEKGNKQRIIDHFKFLTHQEEMYRKRYQRKLREIKQLKNQLEE